VADGGGDHGVFDAFGAGVGDDAVPEVA
jgi:hypothetical protein